MKKIILLTIPILLFSEDISIFDKYHIVVSKWIMDKSDALDRFLAGTQDSKSLSNTKVTLSYELGANNLGKFSNDFDFSLSLNLPRFQDKAKITLEKVLNNKSLVGNNRESQLSKSDENSDNKYNLALSLSQWRGKKASIYLTGGLRLGKNIIDPYIGVVSGYNVISNNKKEFNIKNTIRYYFAGEIKDNLSTQYLYNYSDHILLGWLGNLDYSNREKEQILTSEFIWHRSINKYKFYRVGFIANAKLKHFKHLRKNDFEVYVKYHNKFRDKDWAFYEITPFVDKRKEDNWHTTYGVKLKVGATFGGIKDFIHKNPIFRK